MPQEKVDAIPGAPAADDLLSQMAGDEIDRLLNEAESDSTQPPAARTSPAEPAPVFADVETSADRTFAAPSSDNAPLKTGGSLDSSLDDSIGEAENTPSFADPTASAPAISSEVGSTPVAGEVAAAPAIANTEPAPSASSIAKIEGAAETPAGDFVPANDATGGESFLVRILELISSPLDHVDDAVRTTIGWIAILTVVNALVVLAYVHFVRRR
jgi:hypothetical protein